MLNILLVLMTIFQIQTVDPIPQVEAKPACYFMIQKIEDLPNDRHKITIEYQCNKPFVIKLVSNMNGTGKRNLVVSDFGTTSLRTMNFTMSDQEYSDQRLKMNEIKY